MESTPFRAIPGNQTASEQVVIEMPQLGARYNGSGKGTRDLEAAEGSEYRSSSPGKYG